MIDALFEVPRTNPLHIIGPVGVAERLTALNRLMYGSIADRERGFELTFAELRPGESTPLPDGGQVRGFAADHQDPPEQPLCLRVEADGQAFAFSGDTRPCDGLRQAAAGADLLAAECTHLRPPAGAHTTWHDWQALFGELGARAIVLSHQAAPVRLRLAELAAALPEGLDVRFAEDGMVVEPGAELRG